MTLQPRHFGFALLLHAVLLTLLFTGVQCSHKVAPPPMVQGVLINPSKIPHPNAQPVPQQPPKPDQPPAQPPVDTTVKDQQAQAEAQRLQAQQQAALEAEQKRQQEAAAEQQRKADALKQQQIAAEAQKQAELKKQQEEAQRKADELKQQQAAEEKRKADAQHAQEELQKQLDADAKKREAAAESKRRAKADAERKQAMAELQDQLGVEDAQRRQQEQMSWAQILAAAIERVWSRPAGLQGLYCTLHIDLSPTGEVLGVAIKTSSGNSLFDQSARTAVYAASPLPMPEDKSAFDPSINITFDPDKVAPQ